MNAFKPAARFAGISGLPVAALLIAVASPARANPPPPGSEDYEVLHPYSQWMQDQKDDLGHGCCGQGDGRIVDQSYREGHWWVRIPPAKYSNLPEGSDWFEVPDAKVKHNYNPTHVPVLWVNPYTEIKSIQDLMRVTYCFIPAPDGT